MSERQATERFDPPEECLDCRACQDGPCEVENLVNQVLFVRAGHASLCYQRTSFGNSYICQCPARKEIYRRYGR